MQLDQACSSGESGIDIFQHSSLGDPPGVCSRQRTPAHIIHPHIIPAGKKKVTNAILSLLGPERMLVIRASDCCIHTRVAVVLTHLFPQQQPAGSAACAAA
jgi:hypothetical protein